MVEIDGDEGFTTVPLGPRAGRIRCLAPISSKSELEGPAGKELVMVEDGFAIQPLEVRAELIYGLEMRRRADSGTDVSSDAETGPTLENVVIDRSRLGKM